MRLSLITRVRGVIVLLGVLALASLASAEFFYRNGDQPIVFLGDSITDNQPYPKFIESFILTRYPTWTVTCRNIGWGGDTAGLRQRQGFDTGMKRDILSLKPMAITIDFGMNDARAGEGGLPGYIANTTKLVQQLKAAGARVALLTPSPEERYEADQPAGSGYNTMLAKYSQALKTIAEKEGVPFVDQYTPFVQVIESGRKAGILSPTQGGARLIPDAVHPNLAGHVVMASAILKGLEAPALVSRVELDGTARKVISADGCKVELRDGADLTFSRLDAALPWYLPVDTHSILKIPGFSPLDDLNRYELKVTNLPAANYELLIDDTKVGTYTKDALTAGVNLALTAGPITAQAKRVWDVVNDKGNLYFTRWRNVQIAPLPAWLSGPEIEKARAAELVRLDAQIADREKQLATLRQPTAHVWTLKAAQ
jgi:lysophospholipase L1-like esterase